MNNFSWEQVLCLLKCFPLLKRYISIECWLMVAALPAIVSNKTQGLYSIVGLLLQNCRHIWEPGSSVMRWAFSHPSRTQHHISKRSFRPLKDFQTLFFLASCNYILSFKIIIIVCQPHGLSNPCTFLIVSEHYGWWDQNF